jgi:hypothetical protein
MIAAAQMLDLLATVLTDDPGFKSRIRSDYNRFRKRMTDADARLFSAVKFLRRFIMDHSSETKE